MKLKDVDNWKLLLSTDSIVSAFAFSIKEVFPNMYNSGKLKNWSDYKIVNYVSELYLSEYEATKLIKLAARIAKISAFT